MSRETKTAATETDGRAWIKLSVGTAGHRAGTVLNVDEKTAARLVANGHASRTTEPETEDTAPASAPSLPSGGQVVGSSNDPS